MAGSTSKLWNKHLQYLLWMLRGTKSLSELLRENLSMTRIKGCLLHHYGTPPEATGHPAWASNPHLALGTSQLPNHHQHRWAVPRGATLQPCQASFSLKPRGLEASNKKFLLLLLQIQNKSMQGPSSTKASTGEGQGRLQLPTSGPVPEHGTSAIHVLMLILPQEDRLLRRLSLEAERQGSRQGRASACQTA